MIITMKLRAFLYTLTAGIVAFVWRKPKEESARDRYEKNIRFASDVALYPPLTEEEIREIVATTFCESATAEEMLQLLKSEKFQAEYRIPERQQAKVSIKRAAFRKKIGLS